MHASGIHNQLCLALAMGLSISLAAAKNVEFEKLPTFQDLEADLPSALIQSKWLVPDYESKDWEIVKENGEEVQNIKMVHEDDEARVTRECLFPERRAQARSPQVIHTRELIRRSSPSFCVPLPPVTSILTTSAGLARDTLAQ